MHTSAHLHFKGDCREAFRFYAEVLGGRIVFAMTYGESPAAEQTPPQLRDRIIHARLDLGESPAAEQTPPEIRDWIIHARLDLGEQFLLGCDTPLDRYHAPQGFNVMLAVDQPVDAERVFRALAENGTVTMPFQETFWAKRFGMCTDRFGIPWMVNCAKPLEAVPGSGRGSAA